MFVLKVWDTGNTFKMLDWEFCYALGEEIFILIHQSFLFNFKHSFLLSIILIIEKIEKLCNKFKLLCEDFPSVISVLLMAHGPSFNSMKYKLVSLPMEILVFHFPWRVFFSVECYYFKTNDTEVRWETPTTH